MSRRKKRAVSSTRHGVSRTGTKLSPVMQLGVVFIIVTAMLLLMYAARMTQ